MKTLLINISRCNEVKNAIENSNHPCHRIVNSQEKLKSFQNPEPWNGDINKADILFLSSNPSYNPEENYPTDSWDDENIYNYHKNRFSDEHYQKNKKKVLFWQKTRKSASCRQIVDEKGTFCIVSVNHSEEDVIQTQSRKSAEKSFFKCLIKTQQSRNSAEKHFFKCPIKTQ